MKVAMLNTFDGGGGAAIAAGRLFRGIQQKGVEASLLVQFKTGDARDVLCNDAPWRRMARSLKLYLGLLPVRLYANKPENNFSPALLPDTLIGQLSGLAPDIVHLHWMAAGFCRVETLAKFNKPLVWTLHDSWAFTGGCHVPFACKKYRERCGACPVLGSSHQADLSRWTWQRKEKAWRDLNLTVVAPSRWLADCARASALFRNLRVETIPNGLDLTRFRPVEKALARDLLGVPQEKKLILFGAVGGASDRNKGFHLLLPALQKVAAAGWKAAAELIIFGASEPACPPSFGMPARYLGRLHDDISLVLLYAAADLFVSPSLLENLPNTVMEAMACSTPCVAFNQGGMPELIEHQRTGYLARPYEIDDLAAGIIQILGDEPGRQEMAQRARRKIEKEFSLDSVAARYVGLYREILGNTPGERHD